MASIKSSNSVVRKAIQAKNASGDLVGAASFLSGMEMSERIRRRNDEMKSKAKGTAGHAIRDLKGSMSFLDALVKSGGDETVNGYPASVAAQTVKQSIDALSRLFGV